MVSGVKGGKWLDDSCSLCVKTCGWAQRQCSISCYVRSLLIRYRKKVRLKVKLYNYFCFCDKHINSEWFFCFCLRPTIKTPSLKKRMCSEFGICFVIFKFKCFKILSKNITGSLALFSSVKPFARRNVLYYVLIIGLKPFYSTALPVSLPRPWCKINRPKEVAEATIN